MSLGLNKTKRRISSVKSTQKITKAMGMVATVKLGKLKNKFEKNKDYISSLESIMARIFAYDLEDKTHYSMPNEEAKGDLYIVINSSLGLCASYNSNMFKFVDSLVKENDFVAPIGTKGINHFERSEKYKNIIHDFEEFSKGTNIQLLEDAVKKLKDDFNSKKYKHIYLIYTKYINSLKFEPRLFQLLPVSLGESIDVDKESRVPFFDPSPRELIHLLLPQYLYAQLLDKMNEASLSEQASRRSAMDNANDNADELLDKLTIEYNKARQAAITQEITEVVGGANAQ